MRSSLSLYAMPLALKGDLTDEELMILQKFNQLGETDRATLMLFSEYRSYRSVAEIYGLSHTAVRKKIIRIISGLRRR